MIVVQDTIPPPPPPACNATYFVQSTNLPRTRIFNSSQSTGGSGAADTIVARFWNFGDGSSATNTISPTHTFNNNGIYNVCLTITSASGCSDTICTAVPIFDTIPPPPDSCIACFNTQVGQLTAFFASSCAQGTGPNDPITERKWNFGDGSLLTGNVVNPSHTYNAPGTYNVCLTIKTLNGCQRTICRPVVIPPLNNCVANFTWEQINTAPRTIRFNSSPSIAAAAGAFDSIIQRRWSFGNGDTLGGNVVSPLYQYSQPGTYQVCLRIKTINGCVSEICKQVIVQGVNAPCDAIFTTELLPTAGAIGSTYRFNSSASTGDSITQRIWIWGDGTPNLTGNVVAPTHTYTSPGSYTACLKIISRNGCIDSTCKTIVIQLPPACRAAYTFQRNGMTVNFNSSSSLAVAGPTPPLPPDTITARTWIFGDGTSLQGNVVSPSKTYQQPGIYNVCLRIKTARGCESQECKTIVVSTSNAPCNAFFTAERIGPKKVRFNHNFPVAAAGDSIVERKWRFGDGQQLLGNNPSPVHEYPFFGSYTACLRIKTASGCIAEYCRPVLLQDSTPNPANGPVKIVTLYPVPVTTQLNAVVWSQNNNVNATIAIYDVYGVIKWSAPKVLVQGNNIFQVPTGNLLPGPYFFRVTTVYGVQSKPFYKL
jgi:PKD repeat protein